MAMGNLFLMGMEEISLKMAKKTDCKKQSVLLFSFSKKAVIYIHKKDQNIKTRQQIISLARADHK